MDLYRYIAYSDPYGSKALMASHGYAIDDTDDPEVISEMLAGFVSQTGERGLKEIVKMHPDRDIIIDYYIPETQDKEEKKEGCGCSKCKEKAMMSQDNSGKTNSDNHSMMSLHQGNIFLIAAALMLGIAVIVSSNQK